jgi:hypothetical protein
MRHNDFVNGILFGTAVTGLFAMIYLQAAHMPMPAETRAQMAACQQSLPRDQECELVITAQIKQN